MFRVLSEEEARKAIRWQAPELGKGNAPVADTRQVVSSLTQLANQKQPKQKIRSALPKSEPKTHTSAPELQASHPIAASSTNTSPVDPINPDAASTVSISLPNPSADMLQSSYDEGYSRGLEEGHARGYAEGNAALHQQTVLRLNGVIAALEQSRPAISDSEIEQEVTSLSLEIARVLLKRELRVDVEALGKLVQLGLEQLPSSQEQMRQVRLHPLDALSIRELLVDTVQLEIVDDSTLAQGDCVVECASSVVHAGVDNWMDSMASQLGLSPVSDSSTDNRDRLDPHS
ncbi:MAG: FliH/SctL family protein [Granulosicoccus sp.]